MRSMNWRITRKGKVRPKDIGEIKAGQYFMHPEHGAVRTEYDSHFGAVCVRLLRMYAWKYVMVRDLTPTTIEDVKKDLASKGLLSEISFKAKY